MEKTIHLLFLLSAATYLTWAYPNGAPPALVCDSMSVKHGSSEPQTSELPYNVSISATKLSPGEETDITISGKDFRGFFVQVRKGDNAVGSFITGTQNGEYQAMTCHNYRGSAAIQTDATVKKLVTLRWKAPQDKGTLHVYVTMVEEFATFWEKQQVGTIEVL